MALKNQKSKSQSKKTQPAPVPQAAPQPQQTAPQQKSNTGCWIAGIIGGCCCLLVVVIVLLLIFFGVMNCSTYPFSDFSSWRGMEVPSSAQPY